MFISALLTKFRTNPTGFTAYHPAKRRLSVIETAKKITETPKGKILSAFQSFQTAFRQSADKQEYPQMASELGFSGIS